MPRYRAFGTAIESDVALPALMPAPGARGTAIEVTMTGNGPLPEACGAETDWYRFGAGGEMLRIKIDTAGDFRFRYADGARFLVRADGLIVIGRRPRAMPLEDAAEYLLGPILGFALRLRGVVCLHAAAIAAGGSCFAVVGPAGHGKSTFAAACARRGLPVLTDDVLALTRTEGAFHAHPAYPRIRLWPQSAAALFGSAEALPRLCPANQVWDKRYVDLAADPDAYQAESLPLRRIYLPALSPRGTGSLETLPRAEALVELLGNVYTRSRPHRSQRAREFAALHRLARTVPVKRIRGPVGMRHLSDLCRMLVRDCNRGSDRRIGRVAGTNTLHPTAQ